MLKKAYILILLSVFLVGCNNTEENTEKEESGNTQENTKKEENSSKQESTGKEDSHTQDYIEKKKLKEITNFDGNSKVVLNNDYKRIILWKNNDKEKYKSILLKKKNTLKIINEKKDEQIYYGNVN
ncbi:hypothetical protein EIG99_05065 [Staphylococcus condimenti]|uniref:Lipoprotein n=2 Tax=Bacillota TaxID=1239 RepID=A0A4V2DWL0_9STAP|nr:MULTISPECIES: hypothetical protein [Staphylococcus]HIQ90480.1 hypothetical protein [Candidatus Coprosoma intestinipullorum]MDW8556182.1 hypothetical protein [Staphylococcus xylosus]OEK66929.1 hypothetical protein AST00_07275 [Staphylococcus equorum]RZI02856.1 hypothetical protein EIG99_05065 [Staphylococcus condimenti]RZI05657.1 hypothetical protein EIG98_00830 [Staphylococcus condimenti]